ncbi:hypothetical protein KDW_32440 [Dictyobacter vulcani]|uniref:HAMP domain-containing protein n=1 Tax=Dictyobacter vulcani TaxID=2607529 RepID=A0A5J4KPJ3_9CHLR|nr:hypothetical protein [Dictyobacter vulcani]GER89082.1 hypothetical protein KDW_32440 [Dictyobacter vulcani]
MNNPIPSGSLGEHSQRWSPDDLIEQPVRRNGLVQWWYDNTALPAAPANASFIRREASRKSHLLSTIIFWLFIMFLLFIPACFVVPNHYIIWVDIGMLVICLVSVFFNRVQRPEVAGLLLTIGFELALTAIIFTTQPLDEPSIQQYELFVFGELLVSLLSPGSVFLVMLYNIGIISTSLFLQPHTATLAHDLQTQGAAILIRPVGVQFLVAFVSWLWVRSAFQAIKRADRAEMIAKLEEQLETERKTLEEGIKLILDTHVAVANGDIGTRAPLTQNNVLWQIARSLNMLLDRLQRALRAERELQRVTLAVNATVQNIQQATQSNQTPSLPLTQVPEIDPLIVEIQGKTFSYAPSIFGQSVVRLPDEP